MPDVSQNTVYMNGLLKHDAIWMWTELHQQEFDRCKASASDHTKLRPFEDGLETVLICDGSKIGLGFVLLQVDKSGQKHIIKCGLCGLSGPQKRYSASEIEISVVCFALEKCSFYLSMLMCMS